MTGCRVDQRITAAPNRTDGHDADGNAGDCMRAALAMVLAQDLDDVPHMASFGATWWRVAREHVRDTMPGWDLGYYPRAGWLEAWPFPFYRPDTKYVWTPALVVGGGPSPRGPFGHCVALHAATGDLWHDPHPSRAGVLEVDEIFGLIGVEAAGALPAWPELTA